MVNVSYFELKKKKDIEIIQKFCDHYHIDNDTFELIKSNYYNKQNLL
jgi:hypothetical protein